MTGYCGRVGGGPPIPRGGVVGVQTGRNPSRDGGGDGVWVDEVGAGWGQGHTVYDRTSSLGSSGTFRGSGSVPRPGPNVGWVSSGPLESGDGLGTSEVEGTYFSSRTGLGGVRGVILHEDSVVGRPVRKSTVPGVSDRDEDLERRGPAGEQEVVLLL